MATEDKAGEQSPAIAAADEEVTSTPPKLHKGWLRHIASNTNHDVDDVEGTLSAYPGQYEKTKAPSGGSGKIGWPEPRD